ncbi:zinc transporter ZupT [Clostridium celatum]|uniref:zinc transporter ZupT n=1 Tax=Clostridium celatum TaxID=36834 RepID=UPI001899DC3C|nr:zinc transporter ZupT [Clostridium celatum]MCE9655545.1 zinc transporter ZupT [Clostridium celatum]MDU2265930.1 zinc transporter ZupT [Clostridium celatum]MDU6296232.1 zinc transporter ZupT [Clostridium celatum]MDY3362266.1 zinc transporter ZupT [Clostridium celatum]
MLDKNSIFPLILSTIAGLSTVLGAVIVFFTKNRNERFLTFALGFSAGVMITVSFTDLFPTAENAISKYHGKVSGILWSILFLLIGALMAYLIDSFIPAEEKGTVPKVKNDFDIFRVGLVSTIALMIHNFPEGIATFVSSYQDTRLGLSVTFAIALHNIPEGIAIAMPIYFATKSRFKAIKYSFLSGMAEPLGALIAFLCLKPFINELILGIIFAVVCGIMLYISFAELIPSSRKYGYTRISLASIFLGICIMPITHLFL